MNANGHLKFDFGRRRGDVKTEFVGWRNGRMWVDYDPFPVFNL